MLGLAWLTMAASAAPFTLKEVTVRPDPLEPVLPSEERPRGRVEAPPIPAIPVRLEDPGDVAMLGTTVDTPPALLESSASPVADVRCEVELTVDRTGRPADVRVVRCDDDRRARRARRRARRLRFTPGRYDGRTVTVIDHHVEVSVVGDPVHCAHPVWRHPKGTGGSD